MEWSKVFEKVDLMAFSSAVKRVVLTVGLTVELMALRRVGMMVDYLDVMKGLMMVESRVVLMAVSLE
jgi:hypothetical protein